MFMMENFKVTIIWKLTWKFKKSENTIQKGPFKLKIKL